MTRNGRTTEQQRDLRHMQVAERMWAVICGALVFAEGGAGLWAAAQDVAAPTPEQPELATNAAGLKVMPISVKADRMEYDRSNGVVTAYGNVVVRRGDEVVTARRVVVNMRTQDVEAYGDVVYQKPGTVWRGEEIRYNFATKQGVFGAFDAWIEPFRVQAERSAKVSELEYVFHGTTLTTCKEPEDRWHYYVRARRADVIPGDRLKAYHAVLYAGGLPIFYTPYWYRSLDDRDMGIAIEPGYRSRMGYYLLTSVKYRLNPTLKAETQVDYRIRRGFAGGQEFKWREAGLYEGRGGGYYAADQEGEEVLEGSNTMKQAADRYRLRLQHRQTLGESTYLLTGLDYLSDDRVLEDFFRHDYRQRVEPDNFAVATYSDDFLTANLLARVRLNDFYTVVNRLPELSVEIPRQEVPRTPLYYEGQSAAANLQMQWARGIGDEDYSAFRFDTEHMLYYPTRHFGFLNVMPRAGYRGTYYSKTLKTETVSSTMTCVTTNVAAGASGTSNPVVTTTTVTTNTTQIVAARGGLRSLPEIGLETSFRAFKTWEDWGWDDGDGIRHIVEPYANYTLIPEPNLTPDRLYPFDDIDRLGEEHSVRLGMRNIFQTKKKEGAFDFVDVDTYITYRITHGKDEKDFSDLYVDADLRPTEVLTFRVEVALNLYESDFDLLNIQARLRSMGPWGATFEYHYRRDEDNLAAADVSFSPNQNWTFGAYGRYDLEGARLEEHMYSIRRNYDCAVLVLGFDHVPGYTTSAGEKEDDDYRVMAEVWLTAFPDVRLGFLGRD